MIYYTYGWDIIHHPSLVIANFSSRKRARNKLRYYIYVPAILYLKKKGGENITGYKEDIEKITEKNTHFRQVLFTGKYCQLVVMSLKPKEEIGMEAHPTVDQFFRIEEGRGKVIINGEEHLVNDGEAVIVPAGNQHNVINISATEDLKLYTIYSPPNHPEGTIHKTKQEAMATKTS